MYSHLKSNTSKNEPLTVSYKTDCDHISIYPEIFYTPGIDYQQNMEFTGQPAVPTKSLTN